MIILNIIPKTQLISCLVTIVVPIATPIIRKFLNIFHHTYFILVTYSYKIKYIKLTAGVQSHTLVQLLIESLLLYRRDGSNLVVTFGLCNYKKCEQSDKCKRFLHKGQPNPNPIFFRFKNICNQDNNFEWQIKLESTELVVKEEGENT